MTLLSDSFVKRKITSYVPDVNRTEYQKPEKTLRIQIELDKMQELKANGYRLCLAKATTDRSGTNQCNIVWQSYNNFVCNTVFSWDSLYYLFAGTAFQEYVNINDISTSNQVMIQRGQQAVLDTSGRLGKATDGKNSEGITLINECADIDIYPGFIQVNYGINHKMTYSPACFMERKLLIGAITLIPDDNIIVWMDQELETGTLFRELLNPSIVVNMNGKAEEKIFYDGTWKTI